MTTDLIDVVPDLNYPPSFSSIHNSSWLEIDRR